MSMHTSYFTLILLLLSFQIYHIKCSQEENELLSTYLGKEGSDFHSPSRERFDNNMPPSIEYENGDSPNAKGSQPFVSSNFKFDKFTTGKDSDVLKIANEYSSISGFPSVYDFPVLGYWNVDEQSTIELLSKFSDSILACRMSLRKVVENFEQLLNDNVQESIHLEISEAIHQTFNEEDIRHDFIAPEKSLPIDNKDNSFESESNRIKERSEDDIPIKLSGNGNHLPKYVHKLTKIMDTLKYACNSLSHALPPGSRKKRNTEELAQKIVKSLSRWVDKWSKQIQTKTDDFIDSCLTSEHCVSQLKRILESAVSIMKETQGFGSFDTLLESSIRENVVSESLTPLEKVALAFDQPFDLEETQAFDVSHALLKSESFNHLDNLEKFENHDDVSFAAKIIELSTTAKEFKNIRKEEPPKYGEIYIDEEIVVAEVPPTFLSVAVGSWLIRNKWGNIPAWHRRFFSLTSALSPAILRVGGSAANFLTYNPTIKKGGGVYKKEGLFDYHPKLNGMTREDKNKQVYHQIEVDNEILSNLIPTGDMHPKHNSRQYEISLKSNDINKNWKSDDGENIENLFLNNDERKQKWLPNTGEGRETCVKQLGKKDFSNFTMARWEWEFLINATEKLNWTLLFDLNQFYRFSDSGKWNPTNAKLILNDKNTKRVPIIWHIGNEPNAYRHSFGVSVTPEQMVEDLVTLKKELQLAGFDISSSSIVGPDVTRPRGFDENKEDLGIDSMKFLTNFLKAGGSSKIDALTWHQYYFNGRTATSDDFRSPDIMNFFPRQLRKVSQIRNEYAQGMPIWITETSSGYGGGAPDLSDRFADVFLWLDKLGSAAFGGADAVFRQTLYAGCYTLLDHKDLTPFPSYWASVLHKKLVGTKVLLPRVRITPQTVRVYAHCAKGGTPGSIVIFGMNLGDKYEELRLYGKDILTASIKQYQLTAPSGDFHSADVLLNGKLLRLRSDDTLPQFIGRTLKPGILPFVPRSAQFFVLENTGIKLC